MIGKKKVEVMEIYLLHKLSGRLIDHKAPGRRTGVDKDILSGMVTAVSSFIEDAWTTGGKATGFKTENSTVMIERGKHIAIAVVIRGGDALKLRLVLKKHLSLIENEFDDIFPSWSGDRSEFEGIQDLMDDLTEKLQSTLEVTYFIPHPYPEAPNFTGRNIEKKMLTEWLIHDETHPLISLVSIAGMGKSSLVWRWLQESVIDRGVNLDGIIWWSFYEKGMTFDSFVRNFAAYKWGKESPVLGWPISDLSNLVYQEFQQSRYLIVLDGIERILKAYFGLGSPYRKDENTIQVLEDEYRTCIDPNAEMFLQSLSTPITKSKTLFTTRLHPQALDNVIGGLRYDLKSLSKEDAVTFFRKQGVKGTRTEIERECEKYGYHPLSLRLLSGLIINEPGCSGDISDCEVLDQIKDMSPREHNILELAYGALDDSKREFISTFAALRSPVDYKAIKVFSKFEREKDLREALKALVNRGFLFQRKEETTDNKTATIYGLHPIVRSYCYDKLDNKKDVHSQLQEFFSKVPTPKRIKSIGDLQPLIELYHHTVGAGRHEEAWDLFVNRLKDPLYFQFGDYNIIISLLINLFPKGEVTIPLISEPRAQNIILHGMGNCYSLLGQPSKAIPFSELANKIASEERDMIQLVIGLGNLADDQHKIGDLESAEANLLQGLELGTEIDEDIVKWAMNRELIRTKAYIGEYTEAKSYFKMADTIAEDANIYKWQSVNWAYYSLCSLFEEDADEALHRAQKALEFSEKNEGENEGPAIRDIIRAYYLTGSSYILLKNVTKAEYSLQFAITGSRKINLVSLEADILLAIARLRFFQAKKEEALKLAVEALEIATRCRYVLQQADIYLFLAQFYNATGDIEKAWDHAEIARLRTHQMIDVKTGALITKPETTKYKYHSCYERAGKLLTQIEKIRKNS